MGLEPMGGGGAKSDVVNATGMGAGGTGLLTSVKTGGYGMMPAGASKKSQAMMDLARGGRGPDNWFGYTPQQAGAARANVMSAQEEEGREREGFEQQQRMWGFKNQMMQKLLALFGGQGQGGPGGNLNVGMPVQPDPNIMASLRAGVEEQFRPMERAEAATRAKGGRTAFDSTAAGQRQAGLAERKSSAMSQTYLPGQQATVAGYQPGLEAAKINKQGQITPQLIMQALMQGGMG